MRIKEKIYDARSGSGIPVTNCPICGRPRACMPQHLKSHSRSELEKMRERIYLIRPKERGSIKNAAIRREVQRNRERFNTVM